MICKCSHPNCHFEILLSSKGNQEIYYFEDEENFDSYCIFHTPLKIKNNFRISQKELFLNITDDYIFQSILKKENLDFSNVVFLDCDFKDKNMSSLDIDFTNTTFIKNVRFDNLKCKKLILKDTIFLDGGGIKNREKDKNLFIEELEFRPYSLNGDFVIDIGAYVNENGLLEFDKQGVIEKLKFENHQMGDGRIFFIGLNQYLQKADFTNMVLDKVLFQNCDLKNCYFLNAKIAKTEFRNCYFPQNDNRQYIDDISKRINSRSMVMLAFLSIPFMYFMNNFIHLGSNHTENIISIIHAIFVISFLIPILLASYNALLLWISFYVQKVVSILFKTSNQNENILIVKRVRRSFNVHFCIADEKKIYVELNNFAIKKETTMLEKETLQKSLDSLSSSYSQLKDNFKDKDFQTSGDFFCSQRYTELLANNKKDFMDLMIYNIHQFTNGFGESYMKPLFWFIVILFLFALPLTPNQDYTSTQATPLFLIKDANTSNLNSILYLSNDVNSTKNSFYNNLSVINYEQNTTTLYGYDNRYNFHIQKQYILKLDEHYTNINLIHSFSNMIYPFTPEQKRWFQNISEKAVFYSLLESILLWYFTIAFVLALWHRIKR